MDFPYDKAVALFRSWKEAEPFPTLVIDFRVSSLANVHARFESLDVSEESVTLWFGRLAFGNGQVTLPLRNARFTYVRPSDKPLDMRSHGDEHIVGWLELRFPAGDLQSGCLITEYKPGVFVTVSGLGPFGIHVTVPDF